MSEIDTSGVREAGASGPIGNTIPEPHEAESPVKVGGVREDTSDFAAFEKGRTREAKANGIGVGDSAYDFTEQVMDIPDSAYKRPSERERAEKEAERRGEPPPDQPVAQPQQQTTENAPGAESAPAQEAQATEAAPESRETQEAAPGETAAGDGKAKKPGEDQQNIDSLVKRRLKRQERKHDAEMQAKEDRIRELEARLADRPPERQAPAVEDRKSEDGRQAARDQDHYFELLADMPPPSRDDYDSEQKWNEDSDAWDQGKPLVHNTSRNPIPPDEAAKASRPAQQQEAAPPEAKPPAPRPTMTVEQQYFSDIEELITEGTEIGAADDNLLEELKERMVAGKLAWTETMLRTIADGDAKSASNIIAAFVERPVLSSQISRKTEAEQVERLSELAAGADGTGRSKASPPKRDPAPDQQSLHGSNRPKDDSYESSDDFTAFEKHRHKQNGASSPIGVSF